MVCDAQQGTGQILTPHADGRIASSDEAGVLVVEKLRKDNQAQWDYSNSHGGGEVGFQTDATYISTIKFFLRQHHGIAKKHTLTSLPMHKALPPADTAPPQNAVPDSRSHTTTEGSSWRSLEAVYPKEIERRV